MSFFFTPFEKSPLQLIWPIPYQDGCSNIVQAFKPETRLSPLQRGCYLLGGVGQLVPLANTIVYVVIRLLCAPDFFATKTLPWMLPGQWRIVAEDTNPIIPQANLESILKKCKIDYQIVSPADWRSGPKEAPWRPLPPSAPLSRLLLATTGVLWQDETRTVEIGTFRVDSYYHLFVRLLTDRPFNNTTEKQMVPLHRTIGKMRNAFALAWSSNHYAMSLAENPKRWVMEIYPAGNFGTPHQTQVDVFAKVKRNLYMIKGSELSVTGLSSSNIDQLRSHLVSVMQQPPALLDRNQKSPSITSEWVNKGEAAQFAARALLHTLQKSSRVRFIPRLRREKKPVMSSPLHTSAVCAFCLDRVIQKQLLIMGKRVQILYNYAPYMGEEGLETSHFLVVTKHHLENSAISDEELEEEHQMISGIKKTMKVLRPGARHLVWAQEGNKAGQTVPHRHWHVLVFQETEQLQYLRQLALELTDTPMATVAQPSEQFVTEYLRQGHLGKRKPTVAEGIRPFRSNS